MKRGQTGRYQVTRVGGEQVRAFIPAVLPPVPPLALEGELQRLFEAAVLALGRLDGVSTLLPDKALFLYAYVRKEAVLSSQIEGMQSSLSDLLLFELKDPGEFRRSQNWIGGSRPGKAVFVPPPPTAVIDCMAALERFLPFNQGKFGGAGNPPVPPTQKGYATAYLWEETWARDSVLDLVRQFIHEVEEKDEKGRKTGKRSLIFPRCQQLDAARKLVAHARGAGTCHHYLIQHSAESGGVK